MSLPLETSLAAMEADDWRKEVGFSNDIVQTEKELHAAAGDDRQQETILNEWIKRGQTCLFGKTAASKNAIGYCLLSEQDVSKGDEYVREKIAESHSEWLREAHKGLKSAFILFVLSEKIATARPNSHVKEFARRLAALYLEEESIETDRIYHDEVFLEAPNQRRTTWRWKAGVNYFCAQGDQRWWHDHRIPGGMAFSTNSVGHLVKSVFLHKQQAAFEESLAIAPEEKTIPNIDSLEAALWNAMKTIDNAKVTTSGRATELLPQPEDPLDMPVPTCPIRLTSTLVGKNHCQYRGYYHTDQTLPSCYFLETVERPADITAINDLDFTYLFHKDVNNPAFRTMGEGVPIRGDVQADQDDDKTARSFEEEIPIDEAPRLLRALERGS